MKTSRDTAGHELAKGEEKDKHRKNAFEALELAKAQEKDKKGKYKWDTVRRAYFLTSNKIKTIIK